MLFHVIIIVRIGNEKAVLTVIINYIQSGERMVQFKDLANKIGEREVREVIFAKGETIKVFEPDKEDIKKIFDLQEKFIDTENPERLQLTGGDVVELFSILTDIEGLDDLTNEEVQMVVDNPSLALLQAQHVIEGIVTEVYKMVILSVKNQILETDLNLETAKTSNEVMERTLGLAQREGVSKEYAEKVEKAKAKILEFKKLQDEEPKEEMNKSEEIVIPTKQIDKHANVLAQFQNTFGEVQDEE